MVKVTGSMGLMWLNKVVRVVWRNKQTPKDWKEGVVIPIF